MTQQGVALMIGNGLKSRCKDGMKLKYIMDILIHGLFNNPHVIIKIADSQLRSDALTKITTCLVNNPELLGAIIISVLEDPAFKKPNHKSTKNDTIFVPSWVEAIKGSPEFSPVNY
jgi:hypothetical protein